eukprot:scaffold93796_cov31-Tisochrysis_lutea.AAC.3
MGPAFPRARSEVGAAGAAPTLQKAARHISYPSHYKVGDDVGHWHSYPEPPIDLTSRGGPKELGCGGRDHHRGSSKAKQGA